MPCAFDVRHRFGSASSLLLIGSPMPVLAGVLPGSLHDASFISCEIKPPLFLGMGFAIAHEVISPNCQASRKAGVTHCPAHRPVEGCVRLVPGGRP